MCATRLQSVVKDIQRVVDHKVQFRPGTYVKYGGQFENLQNATRRLSLAVPIALALIFIFLHFAFKSMKDTLMIFTAVPLSSVGGILALWVRGRSFSISAGVGFIALFGIAVLNGIVLVEHLKHLRESGMKDLRQLISSVPRRLRPVMLRRPPPRGFCHGRVNRSGAECSDHLARWSSGTDHLRAHHDRAVLLCCFITKKE
jgi:cobalt-zinc-cadmium resistance protein CzcA